MCRSLRARVDRAVPLLDRGACEKKTIFDGPLSQRLKRDAAPAHGRRRDGAGLSRSLQGCQNDKDYRRRRSCGWTLARPRSSKCADNRVSSHIFGTCRPIEEVSCGSPQPKAKEVLASILRVDVSATCRRPRETADRKWRIATINTRGRLTGRKAREDLAVGRPEDLATAAGGTHAAERAEAGIRSCAMRSEALELDPTYQPAQIVHAQHGAGSGPIGPR